MARSNTGSTSNYLSVASGVTGFSAGFTVSCWANITTNSATMVLTGFGASGNDPSTVNLRCEGTHASLAFAYADTANKYSYVGTADNTFTINVWHHCLGTWNTGNTATPYLDGAVGSTSYLAQTPGSNAANTVYHGIQRASNSFAIPLQGAIAEAAWWNVVLTQGEISALATGIPTWRVRPASLQGYWPLWGKTSPEPDMSMSATRHNAAITGTMAAANHAPVTRSTPRRIFAPKGLVTADTLMAQACL